MKKSTVWYHIIFWSGIYLLWVAVFRSYSVAITRTMTIEFCYLLFITTDYYAINLFALPRLLGRKKYGLFVGSVVLVIAISAALRALLALYINEHYFHPGSVVDYGGLYLRSFFNITIWVLAVTLARIDRKSVV